MSHHWVVLVFCVGASEQRKPTQYSDRALFEVGGVLLNLSFGNTHWLYSNLRNKGTVNVSLRSVQVDESLRKIDHYQQNVGVKCNNISILFYFIFFRSFPNCRFGESCRFIHPPCKFDGRYVWTTPFLVVSVISFCFVEGRYFSFQLMIVWNGISSDKYSLAYLCRHCRLVSLEVHAIKITLGFEFFCVLQGCLHCFRCPWPLLRLFCCGFRGKGHFSFSLWLLWFFMWQVLLHIFLSWVAFPCTLVGNWFIII